MTDEKETHDSYGLVGFHRQSWGGHGSSLFGSSIKHGQVISLKIRRASRRRDLNHDWIHGEEEIIEVLLSQNQFAELLTSMNMGDGVPCTIRRVGRKESPPCPSVEKREQFEREFKADVRKAMRDAKDLAEDAKAVLERKGSVTVAERQAISHKISMLMQHIESNMPFVQSQFNEAMDKTVTEAKAEVEAFVGNKIHSLGINALEAEVARAIAATTESPVLALPDKSAV